MKASKRAMVLQANHHLQNVVDVRGRWDARAVPRNVPLVLVKLGIESMACAYVAADKRTSFRRGIKNQCANLGQAIVIFDLRQGNPRSSIDSWLIHFGLELVVVDVGRRLVRPCESNSLLTKKGC